MVRHMKSSASESKAFQSGSKGEIPGRAKRTGEPFQIETGVLIDSDAKLFMYLIQCEVRLMKSTSSEPGLIHIFRDERYVS